MLRLEEQKRLENQLKPSPSTQEPVYDPADQSNEELTEHTPAARRDMYLELAEQKREQEERKRCNEPIERDYEREHEEKKRVEREKQASLLKGGKEEKEEEEKDEEEWKKIRQCNEGKVYKKEKKKKRKEPFLFLSHVSHVSFCFLSLVGFLFRRQFRFSSSLPSHSTSTLS